MMILLSCLLLKTIVIMNLKSNNCAFYSHLHGQLVFYLASQKLAACMSEFYNLQRVTEEAEVIFFGGFSADKL